MKTIGFFNIKGGIGKTTLVYHIAWMLSEMGVPVVAADFDPQASLTSMFLTEDRLEDIWNDPNVLTVHRSISPLVKDKGQLVAPTIEQISDQLGLIVGDLPLSLLENEFAKAWSAEASDGLQITRTFYRMIQSTGQTSDARVALIDVGSNVNALTRAALLSCDYIIIPLDADISSLHILRTSAGCVREWAPKPDMRQQSARTDTIVGAMKPLGYVVMRHSPRMDRATDMSEKWLAEVPKDYAAWAALPTPATANVADDPNCLAILKDFRALMPLARESRKPMFLLKPADGAFGGHQQAVSECYKAFRGLTENILGRCGDVENDSNAESAASR